MMIRPLALMLLVLPAAAQAADRSFGVGSYSAVRIEGPFEVRITTGTSPRAAVSGDRDVIEQVDIDTVGDTLVVRMGAGGWGETPQHGTASPTVISLSTPALDTVRVNAGANVTVDAMKATSVSLTLAGNGALTVGSVQADRVVALLQGVGTMKLAGKALRVRLAGSGAGSIDASGLAADELTLTHDGVGELHAAARYTADVTNDGLGAVTVDGKAKCVIRGRPAGPTRCGVTSAAN